MTQLTLKKFRDFSIAPQKYGTGLICLLPERTGAEHSVSFDQRQRYLTHLELVWVPHSRPPCQGRHPTPWCGCQGAHVPNLPLEEINLGNAPTLEASQRYTQTPLFSFCHSQDKLRGLWICLQYKLYPNVLMHSTLWVLQSNIDFI